MIDVKGLEGATRRDSVPIIAKIMSEIMDLLFPLHKNNEGGNIITDREREEIIENVQKVVRIAVRRILAGELDIGEFIMTRVFVPNRVSRVYNFRDFGWALLRETTRANKPTLKLLIKYASEIPGELSKTVNGRGFLSNF